MIGHDDSMQSLGIMPCAIAWLFRLIDERRERTGARFSVRVSAVELWGGDENIQDLMASVVTGGPHDSKAPGIYLQEDPIFGTQVGLCYFIKVITQPPTQERDNFVEPKSLHETSCLLNHSTSSCRM